MRIFAPTGSTPVSPVRRKSSGSGDGGFSAAFGIDHEPPVQAPLSSPLGRLDALIGLQELPDLPERKARGMKRGQALLAHLDAIREGLLLGIIPGERIAALRRELAVAVEVNTDRKLAEILAEIDLRAAVELAKLQVATPLPVVR